jgi:hypothetical protein
MSENNTDGFGRAYRGEMKNVKAHGQGTSIEANGSEHKGEWKNDLQNGKGTMTFAYGDKYVGEWKKGKLIKKEDNQNL